MMLRSNQSEREIAGDSPALYMQLLLFVWFQPIRDAYFRPADAAILNRAVQKIRIHVFSREEQRVRCFIMTENAFFLVYLRKAW